ncbi:acyl carrier protein [Kitasatospora sp. GP82]|uniref:acyl carrier protein n=1 Tax=Kitasatospora sp. GP82 TaxID=3035089 RepID=UPI00247396EC|nr:acyl carrier protein [Kitasatospora sp. GP82]MDH6129092.1 acyl carrier protein [Kitasatospora sp. GP82]
MKGRTVDRQPLVITSVDGTEYELRSWLVDRLLDQLPGVERIDTDAQLTEYGLDSVVALGLYGEIGEVFALELEPGALYEFATVDELSLHLAQKAADRVRSREAGS